MTIQQSILDVSTAIGAIAKTKQANIKTQAASFSYQFRGIDDVLDALHPALIECGVTITPQVRDVLPINDGVLLTVDYVVGNVKGDTIVATFVGEGRDRGDKAAQKAQSNAYKYMAFQTFCIPVAVDDSDNNQYKPHEQQEHTSTADNAEPEPVPLSVAEKRMKAVKDAAWRHTDAELSEAKRVAEAKLIVEQALAGGGPPKNKAEVDAIVANIDEMFQATDTDTG